MKRIGLTIAGLVFAGLLIFALAGCRMPDKAYVEESISTDALIHTKFLEYVEADTTLSPDEKEDWKKLVESKRRLNESARKAVD